MTPFPACSSRFARRLAPVVLLLVCACGSTTAPPADGEPVDALTRDAHAADGDSDSGPADAFSPLPGLGTLAGACGVLDDEWQRAAPFFFRNALDLGVETYAIEKLSPGGQEIIADENLGGDSLLSEAFSYEVLHRCELAELLKTEREIVYRDAGGKKTDLLLAIDGRKVGVSVTRAYHYPPETAYTEQEARTLLERKLPDVVLSAANAAPEDAWERAILHILAYDAQHADAVQVAYQQLDAATRDRTIVIVTVTNGDDALLY